MKGTVKWFNDQKGYGFVTPETGVDCFVHHTGILMSGHRTLDEGDRVEFEVERAPRGPKAINVRKLEGGGR